VITGSMTGISGEATSRLITFSAGLSQSSYPRLLADRPAQAAVPGSPTTD
jgi:hypothetical protein